MAPNTKYFANFYYKGDLFLYQEKFLQFNKTGKPVAGTKLEIFACKECQITAHIEEEEKRDENGCVYSIGWMDKRHKKGHGCRTKWNRRDPENPFHEFENQKNRKQVTQTDAAGATFSQTMAAGTNPGLVTSYAGNVSLDPARQQSSSSSVATSSGASQSTSEREEKSEKSSKKDKAGSSSACMPDIKDSEGSTVEEESDTAPAFVTYRRRYSLPKKPRKTPVTSNPGGGRRPQGPGRRLFLPSQSPSPSSTHPISQTVMNANPTGSNQQPTSSSSSSQSMVKPSKSGSNLSFSTPAARLPLDQCISGFVQPAPKPAMKPEQQARLAGIGSIDVPDHSMKLSQHSVDSTKSVPEVRPKEFPPVARTAVTLPANTVPPSTLRSSAFQPYSIAASSRRMPGAPLQSHSAGIGSVDVPDHSMKLSQHSVDSTKSVPKVRQKDPPAQQQRSLNFRQLMEEEQPSSVSTSSGASQSTSEKEEKSEKSSKKEKAGSSSACMADIKDSKGSTVKLGEDSYTVKKKLPEGGFGQVNLVYDKRGRKYALKRQLIRDDQRQKRACEFEINILKNLNGHKNIIGYVGHKKTIKAGVYEYRLLTVYYPTNVLQLMNSRLLSNHWLTEEEILDIFCDVCKAVARLHHSKTPIIHRNLKVDNVLMGQRSGNGRQIYVLCDYGSATTKTLSKDTFSQTYIEKEIQRYTTLSYRAPEMIDLFSGVPIGTKSDIWALGILLYQLCYFSLPFGESPLKTPQAIQNGTYTFPDTPKIPDNLKAIINSLLHVDARHRPNIFQASHLAFSAANRKCPIYNYRGENSREIGLEEAKQKYYATCMVEPSFEEDPASDVVDETASLGQECENPAEKQVNLRPSHRSNQPARESSAKD